MTFGEELNFFEKEHPYQELNVDGATFRYVLAGEENKPSIVLLNGLDMQEMWIKYVEAFQNEYCVLMIEYPLVLDTNQKMIKGLHDLFAELHIKRPLIMGGSDGGALAQLYAVQYPENVSGLVLITTLTIDSDYVRDIKKIAWMTPLLKFKIRLSNWDKMKHKLMDIVTGYFRDETDEEKAYGKSFFEAIVMKSDYKNKYIHAVGLVGDLGRYDPIPKEKLAFLKGKVLLLLPKQDIFSSEDQQRLVNVMTEPDVRYMNGGHITFVMRPEEYISEIRGFIPKCFLK